MSEKLETTINDIEVVVDFDFIPAERMTRHYPGCDAHVEINEITYICGMDLEKMSKVFSYDPVAVLHDYFMFHPEANLDEEAMEQITEQI